MDRPENICSKMAACKLVRSFVRESFVHDDFFVDAQIFSTTHKFLNKSLSRPDGFHPNIVEIGAIRAIMEPFEVRKFHMPFFGEFNRFSKDLGESDYDSIKSRDDQLNLQKRRQDFSS